jgi:mono/diheme cytochrome c family protein
LNRLGLLLIIALSSCGQSFNSNTSDFALIASNFCTDQSNARLCAANEILQTKCANCHTDDIHANWTTYSTDAQWIASGSNRVVPGNADASTIITKLKNYGGNMPDQAPELTDAEAQALRDWIDAL